MSSPTTTRNRNTVRPRKQAAQVVRLVVVGLSRSGKTTFIERISQYTEWQDQPGKSWFFGRVRVDDDLLLHFLEPPIGRQFDYMWLRDVMSRIHATGFVVMVDSTRPAHFGEFLSILYTIRGFHSNAPLIVAANKQDHRQAWAPADMQTVLGIRDIPIMPCIATDHGMVREIVVELLYQVLR